MVTTSRRGFLDKFSTLAAAVTALGWVQERAASGPELKFPSAPRNRLAVASWPFRAFIDSPSNSARDRKHPGMDLKDFAAMVVNRFGVLNVEPLGDHFRSRTPAYTRELRGAVEKAGARVVNIPVSVGASFYDPEPAKRQTAVENGKKWVESALALGSPSIRAHIQGVPNVKPVVDLAAESLGQLADYGAGRNVVVNLENDDLVTEDAFFIVAVIEKVNSPYLCALPDFCNSMLGGNEQFNSDAVSAMFKHAYNIAHVKDSELDDKGRLFTVDIGKIFETAKASGFRGYYSMEWEGQGEPYAGTQKLIAESLKYLDRSAVVSKI